MVNSQFRQFSSGPVTFHFTGDQSFGDQSQRTLTPYDGYVMPLAIVDGRVLVER